MLMILFRLMTMKMCIWRHRIKGEISFIPTWLDQLSNSRLFLLYSHLNPKKYTRWNEWNKKVSQNNRISISPRTIVWHTIRLWGKEQLTFKLSWSFELAELFIISQKNYKIKYMEYKKLWTWAKVAGENWKEILRNDEKTAREWWKRLSYVSLNDYQIFFYTLKYCWL
jgi:hypothetical protein